jgi:hypothetical protein
MFSLTRGHEYMRIVGEWLMRDDGVTRPVVRAKVAAADGTWERDIFLVDSGADRTVFSARLLWKLGFPTTPEPGNSILQGIGGVCDSIAVKTVVELTRDDGGVIHLRGEFAAFTNPTETDSSILGRDVLNLFDLILSRKRNEVLLLAADHQYRVEPI